MATVLLINPKDSELRWSFKVPWSTLHVGSYLKSFGHKITLLDPDTSPDFEMRFRECVQKADLAGFSLMTCQIHYALPLMQFIRKN